MTGPVVLLTTSLARGGAETQVALLAVALRERGWTVHVVSLVEPDAFQTELARAGVEVHSLGMKPSRPDPRGAVRLASILRRVRPAVLHSHLFHANLAGRLARLIFPVPRVISTLHSLAESSHRSPGTRWRDRLYRITDSLADCTVAVCQAVAERHAEAGAVRREKLRIVPNGIDTLRFRPDEARRALTRGAMGASEEFVWLAAGRLMWKKDYPTLLRAAARQPGCTLWIAGSGPLDGQLREMARALGVQARFLGMREDLPQLMNAADGLVLSSVVEGLPMVLLEAAASGLPVVATSAGGSGEVVDDSRTGFLTRCGDDEALAAAMTRLAGLPSAERREMGLAARALAVQRFEMQAVTSQWEALYREG
ncbi:MAG TPA: glycosyltransferase [Bryobacteraceae bacterium]|nr:glycosyltransferase [Bryobacteraceae bacterium]